MSSLLHSVHWDEVLRSKPLAVGLGLFSHSLLIRGEWDQKGHLLLFTSITAWGALAAAQYALDPRGVSATEAFQIAGTTALLYLGSMFVSIMVYRALFHPLRKFPGPFFSRLTKFYSLSYVFPKFQYYKQVEKLHKDYKSDIIRTGPRELSVITADAVPLVHGPMSKCRKGPWYSGTEHIEGFSLHTERNKKTHKERRKAWDRAFNAKALREYEPRVNRHSYALMEKLKEQADEPAVRISNFINFYSFDVMGDIGFSRSFGMLEKGQEDDSIKKLHAGMAGLSIFSHLEWLIPVLTRLSVGAKDMVDFMQWTSGVLRERKKITPPENDVFGWLLDPNEEDIPLRLNADSRLMIVAGSDTTAATLTWLFYELCKNPDAQTKLRKIIDGILPEKAFLDSGDLGNCPHLDGIINETMRLHPAVPSGVQRETPPEGLTLPDQTYIPGETLIWMPMHTLQRDPRYFPSPLTFKPERWTDEAPEFIVDKRAFMPFGTGVYGCAGKNLAFMEMRCVTANLIRNFEMRFAEGEDGRACEMETRDCFTLNVGKLDVRLTRRT